MTLTEHDSDESAGDHEYYANTKISGESSFGDKIMLPCLTHVDLGTKLTVDAEVAEVSCGDSLSSASGKTTLSLTMPWVIVGFQPLTF